MPTLWNLSGDGTFAIDGDNAPGTVIGNGEVSPNIEADGYYHPRIKVDAEGLIGQYVSDLYHTPKIYGTEALGVFTSDIGITGVGLMHPVGELRLD